MEREAYCNTLYSLWLLSCMDWCMITSTKSVQTLPSPHPWKKAFINYLMLSLHVKRDRIWSLKILCSFNKHICLALQKHYLECLSVLHDRVMTLLLLFITFIILPIVMPVNWFYMVIHECSVFTVCWRLIYKSSSVIYLQYSLTTWMQLFFSFFRVCVDFKGIF